MCVYGLGRGWIWATTGADLTAFTLNGRPGQSPVSKDYWLNNGLYAIPVHVPKTKGHLRSTIWDPYRLQPDISKPINHLSAEGGKNVKTPPAPLSGMRKERKNGNNENLAIQFHDGKMKNSSKFMTIYFHSSYTSLSNKLCAYVFCGLICAFLCSTHIPFVYIISLFSSNFYSFLFHPCMKT